MKRDMKPIIQASFIILALLTFVACQPQTELSDETIVSAAKKGNSNGKGKNDKDDSAEEVKQEELNHAQEIKLNRMNMRVNLADSSDHKRYDEIDQVVVTIKEVILKINGGEVSIAQNIGAVDLMTLKDGREIGIANAEIPLASKVNQIRLVLEDHGNYIQYIDGSYCDMKTPSQQQSGLKIIHPEFIVNEGETYSLTLDFNAEKSVVFRGNGSCLLKPVLKWGGITSTPIEEEEPEEEDPVVEDPVVEDPVVEDPVVEDPVVEDPVVEDPVVEDPVVEDPVVEDPVVEDPVVEDPVVEDPVVEDPVVEDPVIEDPVVEDPVVEDPVIEDPVIEDPVVEDPVNDEPDMEMCYNVDFDLFDSSTWPADFVWEDYAHCY